MKSMKAEVNKRHIRTIALLALSLLLAACSRVDNLSDLQAYVNEIKSRPGAEVEPVPEFTPYEGFIYGAAALRSPFDVPLIIDSSGNTVLAQDVEPDFEREREELENQSLSELTMVGMIELSGRYEALIEDGFGEVHRVVVGNYMGRNFGRIENITDVSLEMIEIVPSGSGGWVERPQTLTLQ